MNMNLFSTGFLQVFFVAVNTFFISKGYYVGVLVCGFIISFIWSFNVKRVAFGTNTDRLIYASGAALGSLFGLVASQAVFKYLQ
jgi:hypothetical protein